MKNFSVYLVIFLGLMNFSLYKGDEYMSSLSTDEISRKLRENIGIQKEKKKCESRDETKMFEF